MYNFYLSSNDLFYSYTNKTKVKLIRIKDRFQVRYLLFLQATINKFVIQLSSFADNYLVHINSQFILPLMFYLRSNILCRFGVLVELVAMDTLTGFNRFFICYNLLSLNNNIRIYIKTRLSDSDSVVSITSIFINANWLEREVWDLFGIFFYNHPDLRRILTDYGFGSHPLRKDFPLTGFKEINYSENLKMIRGSQTSLSQEYRVFFLRNPWGRLTEK
jgi:NADH/F420H2 dehydrogenase subunit C